jgi:hypothetical protein
MSKIQMNCLQCGNPVLVEEDSYEAKGVFNVFCNGEHEDEYAWTL